MENSPVFFRDTVKEVAQALHLPLGRIHHFISEGRIQAIKVGPIRLITQKEFQKFKSMDRRPARPKPTFGNSNNWKL